MERLPESGRSGDTGSPPREKPSRLARRHRRESRFRKRLAAVLILLVLAALVSGWVLDLPVIGLPRRAWERLRQRDSGPSGIQESQEYLFQTHPQTGRRLEGDISVLLCLTGRTGEGEAPEVLYLALFTLAPENGGLQAYLVPEVLLTYDASGRPLRLRDSLRGEGGDDLLRSTVGNLAGTEVDYLLRCDLRDAVRIMQSLDLPPVVLEEDAQFRVPLSGEVQSVFGGQRIGDADRLLYYLLAADRADYWDGYSRRVERLREYLPRALESLCRGGGGMSPEEVTEGWGSVILVPGTGSAERDASYALSMLRAAAAVQGEIACRGVPRVEVLNGCGVPELGRKVGERLADMGIPLGETSRNAKAVVDGEEVNDFSHLESLIVCRSADPRARAFARYLGVQLSVREIKEEPGAGAEVVLIAGKDMAY